MTHLTFLLLYASLAVGCLGIGSLVVVSLRIKSVLNGYASTVRSMDRSPLKSYLLEEMDALHKKIRKLQEEGVQLNPDEVRHFSHFFFQNGKGAYTGIESNLPSTYFQLYPNYLKEHEQYLKKLEPGKRDKTIRILIARTGGEMRTDAIMHPQHYRDFIAWHNEHHVGLYWIEHDVAERIRAELSLETTDIALWDQVYAVTFSPDGQHEHIRLRLVDKKEPAFSKVEEYVGRVITASQPLTIEIDKLPIIPADVVNKWEGYIGDLQFRKEGIGTLFKKELDNKWVGGRVLDAAAGSGYETVLLSRNDLDVTANEVDPVWNDILKSRVDAEHLPTEIYQYDWRKLSSVLKPVYGAVIAVGNSLCMVIGKSQREQSIREFYKILKPGGKLIIDERNFDLIFEKLKAGEPYYSKGVMYACDKMNAELSIEDATEHLIRFSFFDVTAPKKVLGSLIVQAPKQGEIQEMLRRVGFKDIHVYADLNEKPSQEAGFYTYVATK